MPTSVFAAIVHTSVFAASVHTSVFAASVHTSGPLNRIYTCEASHKPGASVHVY